MGPFGVGAIEGQAGARRCRSSRPGDAPDAAEMTERAATDTNAGIVDPTDVLSEQQRAANGGDPTAGNGADRYGPGEEPRPREGEPTASAHGELL